MTDAEHVVEFTATPESLPRVRHAFVDWCTDRRIDDQTIDELAVVVSELCTNAVEASPSPDSPIHLVASISDDRMVVEVRDRGPGFDQGIPERPPAPSVLRGRGLVIVRALVDELSTGRDGSWTVMRAERPLAVSRV